MAAAAWAAESGDGGCASVWWTARETATRAADTQSADAT